MSEVGGGANPRGRPAKEKWQVSTSVQSGSGSPYQKKESIRRLEQQKLVTGGTPNGAAAGVAARFPAQAERRPAASASEGQSVDKRDSIQRLQGMGLVTRRSADDLGQEQPVSPVATGDVVKHKSIRRLKEKALVTQSNLRQQLLHQEKLQPVLRRPGSEVHEASAAAHAASSSPSETRVRFAQESTGVLEGSTVVDPAVQDSRPDAAAEGQSTPVGAASEEPAPQEEPGRGEEGALAAEGPAGGPAEEAGRSTPLLLPLPKATDAERRALLPPQPADPVPCCVVGMWKALVSALGGGSRKEP